MSVERLWRLKPHDPDGIRRLMTAVGVSPVVAQVLINRHMADEWTARTFLDTSMTGLHSPDLLPGVTAAAERIARAVTDGTRVCIYGDYDVDGITGTAILFQMFRRLGRSVVCHIPDRDHGYGIKCAALRQLHENGVQLVISVDCGITAVREAALARELGMGLIVTDHHEFRDELPAADVLVHPRLPGSAYPFGDLSGAGVAFKLAWAVCQRVSGGKKVRPELREFLLDALALASLGLVADVMPLVGENRVLVRHGLERLRKHTPMGLKPLLDAAKLRADKPIRAEDVSFRIAPRMNAAGRIGRAARVLEMLTTSDPTRAAQLAEDLERDNAERQRVEREIVQAARDMIDENGWEDDPALVLADQGWHAGVIGIVAGRLADQFARPVLVAGGREDGTVAAGSGRSVRGFALHEALMACTDILRTHGGHAAAAGFSLDWHRLDELRDRFCDYVAAKFPDGVPPAELELDAEVPLAALTMKLVESLDDLEPYGHANPRPRFLAAGVQIDGPPRLMGGDRHMSFRVRQGATTLRAVAFGMGERARDLMADGGRCCLAFTPKVNEWNGSRTVEMEVVDFQPGPVAKLS